MLKNLLLALALLVISSSTWADDVFPQPAGLEPNVRFWTRIYSEIDGDGGLLHDSEHLGVVYEAIRIPPGLSRRSEERRIDASKSRIRSALRALGGGKRTGLNPEQERILALWPKGTTNATFRRAASHVRFQLGQADKFRAGLIRQGAWNAYIEQALVDHGVPKGLGALPHVESSFNARAYSRVGAAGLWQFTRATGRRYLRVDTVVDERLDLHRATVAAALLLRDNYKSLGAWPLAITAYNHGVSGMRRAVRKMGTNDISEISKHYKSRTFGFASRNFYAEFLAAKEIDANPARFFGPLRRDHPVVVEVVEMPHYYKATSLVKVLGLNIDKIRDFNPALRPSVWNGSKYVPRGYELRIPQGSRSDPIEVALAKIPASERRSKQHRDRLYKVRRGDSLSLIASRYDVGVRELVALNNLRSRHRIHAGQVLVLPDNASSAMTYAKRWDEPADGTYTVRRGDTISRIAKGFGIRESDVVAFNDLKNRNQISVGQKLRVVKPKPTTPAPTPATEPIVLAQAAEPPTPPPSNEASRRLAVPAGGSPADTGQDVAGGSPAATRLSLADAAERVVAATPAPPEPVPAVPTREDPQPLAEPAEPVVVARVPTAAELVSALTFEQPSEEPIHFLESFPKKIEAEDLAATEEVHDAEWEEPILADAPTPLLPNQLPDPSNYAVSDNDTIVVQADETLGHYADWLEIRTSQLRSLNRMRRNSTVVIGRRTKLDFSHASRETFERRRLEYHRTLQEEFFGSYTVTGTETHLLRRGDTMWYLAVQKYKLPVWLLRQYNPDLDFAALPAGSRLVIPNVEPRQS